MAFNYNILDNSILPFAQHKNIVHPDVAIKRTLAPTTTGTSVLGIKFDKGVMIAADMLGSFGSLAKYRNLSRVMEVNKQIALGCGGDYADFQFLREVIRQKIIDETCLDDGFLMKPKSLQCWITRVLYNRRSKFDPLWVNFVVGGLQDGKPYLATVDKLGTAYEDDCIATGYGSFLAIPLLREALDKNKKISEKEALELISKSLQVLFYRDARSFEKYEVAVVTEEGVKINGPLTVETNWDIAEYVRGYD